MKLEFSRHAKERMQERKVSRREVELCISGGSKRKVGQGRTRFRRVFPNKATFRGRKIRNKRVELLAVRIDGGWRVVTVLVNYF